MKNRPVFTALVQGIGEPQGGKEKILLTSVGIKPMTSGLDPPLLSRLSYQFGKRKSGTILGGESQGRES